MVKIVVIEEESDQFAKKLKQCLEDNMVPYWETKETVTAHRYEDGEGYDSIVHTMVLVDYEEEGES